MPKELKLKQNKNNKKKLNYAMNKNDINPGDKVHYNPSHGKKENGIVKSLHPSKENAFVVYNCGGDWENYESYTAASTDIKDLLPGWHDKE